MANMSFDREAAHARQAIASASLRSFAVPHLLIDNVFPDDLVARINENWPDYLEGFFPEVKGNHIIHMFRPDYAKLAEPHLSFWRAFNETLWPVVVSSVAEAFAVPEYEVFGDLYERHLSLDMPLTLMQADPTYPGHDMHTHFYHCPHWAFTILLYIDPEDVCSKGTGIHQLLPATRSREPQTSYQSADSDWRAEVAMDTFHWLDPLKPDRVYRDQVADYKASRLFVFMDGPLALHSVPFDSPDHTPSPARARDGGRHARRRILRSHIKVHHQPFYDKHSALLREKLEPERYMRVLAPNAQLNDDDRRYRDEVLRPFFAERLRAYVRAAEKTRQVPSPTRTAGLWDHLRRRPPRDRFLSQLVERIP